MKNVLASILLAAFALSASAVVHPPEPPAKSPSTTTSTSNAGAAAGAVAGAASLSGSNAQSNATGGTSSSQSGSSAASLGSINNGDSGSMRSYAVALPAPAFTPPLPIIGCPQANVEQSASAIGWNFASHAEGHINTDNCTAIMIYNAMLDRCAWQSAQVVLMTLTLKVLPGANMPVGADAVDMTTAECATWKSPPVKLPPEVVTEIRYLPAPAPLIMSPALSDKSCMVPRPRAHHIIKRTCKP